MSTRLRKKNGLIATKISKGAKRFGRLADDQQFRMSGHVGEFACSVACSGNDLAIDDEYRADGDFTPLRGGPGLGQGHVHISGIARH